MLGQSKANGAVPVDPSSMKVDPLVEGVKVSWAKTGDLTFGPEGAEASAGQPAHRRRNRCADRRRCPRVGRRLPQGICPTGPRGRLLVQRIRLRREFFAHAARSLGLTGDWTSQWQLKGRAAGTTNGKPIRIPFAELHADPVIQVGPVPIVVNLDLVCYFRVDADGHVTVDAEQDLKGDFRIGGNFTWAKGWSGVSESHMTGEPRNDGPPPSVTSKQRWVPRRRSACLRHRRSHRQPRPLSPRRKQRDRRRLGRTPPAPPTAPGPCTAASTSPAH
ncbi:hypothetical protein [Streptomyces griseorubiginosus]